MINNKPKALNIYQYGKLVKTTKTIKEAYKFVGVSGASMNQYLYGNVNNSNGYTFEFLNPEYQEIFNQEKAKWFCNSKYTLAKERLDKIRQSDWYLKRKEYYAKELMDFCVYRKWRKAYYWRRVLMREDLITLKKTLNILNDVNSTVYSIKDTSFFDLCL